MHARFLLPTGYTSVPVQINGSPRYIPYSQPGNNYVMVQNGYGSHVAIMNGSSPPQYVPGSPSRVFLLNSNVSDQKTYGSPNNMESLQLPKQDVRSSEKIIDIEQLSPKSLLKKHKLQISSNGAFKSPSHKKRNSAEMVFDYRTSQTINGINNSYHHQQHQHHQQQHQHQHQQQVTNNDDKQVTNGERNMQVTNTNNNNSVPNNTIHDIMRKNLFLKSNGGMYIPKQVPASQTKKSSQQKIITAKKTNTLNLNYCVGVQLQRHVDFALKYYGHQIYSRSGPIIAVSQQSGGQTIYRSVSCAEFVEHGRKQCNNCAKVSKKITDAKCKYNKKNKIVTNGIVDLNQTGKKC